MERANTLQEFEKVERKEPVPLHAQICRNLREMICDGRLAPGEELPTQMELCEKFQVSRITIARAIRDLAQEGLLVACPGKGTHVSIPAPDNQGEAVHSFRPESMGTHIACIASWVGGPVMRTHSDPYAGMHDAFAKDVFVHTIRLPSLADNREEQVRLLDLRPYSGLIIHTNTNLHLVTRAQSLSIPYVLVENDVADAVSHCVTVDYAPGLVQSLQYLMENNRRRIALFLPDAWRYRTWQVHDTFRLVQPILGFETREEWICQDIRSEEEGYRAMKRALATRPRPDAIVFVAEFSVAGAMRAAEEAGISVARDIACVTMGKKFKPGSTPFRFPLIETRNYERGYLSAKTLTRLINGEKDVPYRQTIPTRFVPDPD